MPSQVTEIKVVIASPGDLKSDRDTVANALSELNLTFNPDGLHFRPLRWEDDVVIGQGNYSQSVINDQLLNEFDVLVGLIGLRLGTPTPEAPSGTVEEIRRALEREKDHHGFPRVLVFFKDAKVSALDSDPTELLNVKTFSEELQKAGVLFSRYETFDALSKSVRTMLSKIAKHYQSQFPPLYDEIKNISMGKEQTETVGQSVTPIEKEEQEWGLLETIEEAKEALTASGIELAGAADELNKITLEVTECTNKLADIGTNDNKKGIQIINDGDYPLDASLNS